MMDSKSASQASGPQLSTRFERERIEKRKKGIRQILLTQHLGPKELAIIEPLFGCDDVKQDLERFEGLASFWNFRVRKDQRRVAKRYKKLYQQFKLDRLPKDLAKRGDLIDRKVAALEKDLRRLRKAGKREEHGQQEELTKNLIRHLDRLAPRLKNLRDLMYTIYQLAQAWERWELQALLLRYRTGKVTYFFNSENTDANIAFLQELKEQVFDKGLAKLDAGMAALTDLAPGVLKVTEEVQRLQAQTKQGLERTEAALKGKSLMAMDRISALEHIENLQEQSKAFVTMGKKAEKAAKMLSGDMKNFDLFVKNVGTLAADLTDTKKAFLREQKRGERITKILKSLDKKTQKLNQAATSSTRLWILSTLGGPQAEHLMNFLAQGKVQNLGEALEADVFFRDFSKVVSGGKKGGVPKEGISIMIKDYPYQVRAFAKDLRKIYKSMHESNLLFLKQVSGASGKEEPDYVDNFENYLNARANTVTRFTDETAQTILSEVLEDVGDDEREAWTQFLGKALVKEMVASNAARKP